MQQDNVLKKELTAFQKGLAISIVGLGSAFGLGALAQSHRSDIDANAKSIEKTDTKLEAFMTHNKEELAAIKVLLSSNKDQRAKEREEFIELREQFKQTAEDIKEIKETLKQGR